MNTTSWLKNEAIDGAQVFILNGQLKVAVLVIFVVLFVLVSSVGVVSNVINMLIYVQLGLNDSMSVQLFSLALTDLSVSILELTFIFVYLSSVICPLSPIDLWALAYIPFVWAVNAVYMISCWITVLITLERCLCVALPFRVRQLFTSHRSATIILIIYLIHIGLFSPAFVVQKFEWIPQDSQGSSNFTGSFRSIYSVVFSESVEEIDYALDITTGLVLFILSQLLLYVCSLVLSSSLKKSTTVRTKLSSTDKAVTSRKENATNLTKQEKRLVRMVLFLSLLHTFCNLPRLSLVIFYHVYPWFDLESQKNIITIVWPAMTVASSITCSSSCFGYFRLNSRYRQKLMKIFRSKQM